MLEKITAETKQQGLIQIRKQNESLILGEKIKLKAILNIKTDFTIAETSFLPSRAIRIDSTSINQNPMLALSMQQVAMASANKNVEKALAKPEFMAGYFLQSLTGNQEINDKSVFYNGVPRFQGVKFGYEHSYFWQSK